MEDLLKAGKVKIIGVSNFPQKKLEEDILPYAAVVPAVDQVGALIARFGRFGSGVNGFRRFRPFC